MSDQAMSKGELSLNPERLRRRKRELETAAAPLTVEHERQKRLKELQCLRFVSELLGRADVSLEAACREIVNALPEAWEHPEIACAQIVLGAEEFKTKNYAESAWMQTQDVLADGKVAGSIEVGYLAERPARDEGPFLKEERELLSVLAAMLAGFIGRRDAEEERGRSHDELELRIEERVSELKAANETVRSEIAERKDREADLQRLNRTLKAHSRSARAMIRAANEADYMQEVCRIVVEDCGHAMVWIGFAEDDAARTVRPVANSGFEEGLSRSAEADLGRHGARPRPHRNGHPHGRTLFVPEHVHGSRFRSLARRGAETRLCLFARPPADGRRKSLRRDHDLRENAGRVLGGRDRPALRACRRPGLRDHLAAHA